MPFIDVPCTLRNHSRRAAPIVPDEFGTPPFEQYQPAR